MSSVQLYSGGAEGADKAWISAAVENNIPIKLVVCEGSIRVPACVELKIDGAGIAKRADAVFAIAWKDWKVDSPPLSVKIDGGTGHTCQAFAQKFYETDAIGIPLFVYFQENECWNQCQVVRTVPWRLDWVRVGDITECCSKSWRAISCIGSRALTPCGREEIKHVMQHFSGFFI